MISEMKIKMRWIVYLIIGGMFTYMAVKRYWLNSTEKLLLEMVSSTDNNRLSIDKIFVPNESVSLKDWIVCLLGPYQNKIQEYKINDKQTASFDVSVNRRSISNINQILLKENIRSNEHEWQIIIFDGTQEIHFFPVARGHVSLSMLGKICTSYASAGFKKVKFDGYPYVGAALINLDE
jgi:hypothetical protein